MSTTRKPWYRRFGTVLVYIALILLGLSMLMPFIWMLSTSLMTELEVYNFPPKFIPDTWRWENFIEAMTLQPFGRYFLNSAIISAVAVTGQLLFCSMAAYAFARVKFIGSDKIFAVYISTMMIPMIVWIIPAFLLVNTFGLMNSYLGLVGPWVSNVWGIFLLRQFFLTIPKDLEDAARIDGASELRIFWTIILPLSKPALATLAIFSFMNAWKDFLWPLIVTNQTNMRTVEVGIANFSNVYSTDWPHQMAAAVIVLLPIIIFFVIAQKHFVRGITFSGMKG
jgi:multiple sugar transport system permease protein